ncbi:MAG: single-stranded DNA-binding protein [Candidatus Paceibacterota bacterium]|jgi:single-strand DNA-binding protein
MYINKVLLYGNITRDPEMKALPSGMQVTSFSMATNRVFKDRDGNKKEQADFHNIVVFGRQAETVHQYLKKGSGVFVEGRIQTRSWDDKSTGEKKYRTEVVADRIQFGPKSAGGGGGSYSKTDSVPKDSKAPAKAEELETIQYPTEEINAEDIPF